MRDRRYALAALLLGLCMVSATVFAHHGFAGRYDEEHPITLDGIVIELQFINPHAAIIFQVRDEDGKVVRWSGYLGSATSLNKSEGWTKNTLKPGDRITILGARAINGAPDMLLSNESRITMTDTGEEIKNSLGTGIGQRGF
ncbi:MAG: hypothetical protein E2O55_03005 [Gammaproteobacteria bacterium]|nr:MAG: hypothetical protein E2O55_03005 [Gammaproteobacteria bacterium]